jgi:hypothetical protein
MAALSLAALLSAADKSLAYSSAGTASGRASILHSLAQQLEQGGFVQLLQRLFMHATELLQSPEQDLLTAANSAEAAGAMGQVKWHRWLGPNLSAAMLAVHLHMLLIAQQHMANLWPDGKDFLYSKPGSGPCLVAAIELDIAVIQYVSKCLDLLPAGAAPTDALYPLIKLSTHGLNFSIMERWLRVESATLSMPAPEGHVPEGAIEALTGSPYPVQHLLTTLMLCMYPAFQQQRAGSTAAAGSAGAAGRGSQKASSSRGRKIKNSSSSAAPAAAVAADGRSSNHTGSTAGTDSIRWAESGAAWQQACAAAAHVPSCISSLTSSLGFSDRLALWVTGAAGEKQTNEQVMASCVTYMQMLHLLCSHKQVKQLGAREQHLQLVSAWLRWLVQLPPSYLSKYPSEVLWFLEHLHLVMRFNASPDRDSGMSTRVIMAAYPQLSAATLVVDTALPELLKLWDGGKMQQLVQDMLLQQQGQGQLSADEARVAAVVAAAASSAGGSLEPSSFDSQVALGISALLWSVTDCCIVVLRNQQRVWQASQDSSSTAQQHSRQPPITPAATLQQTAQLVGLWEAYIRCRAGTAIHSTGASADEGLLKLAKSFSQGEHELDCSLMAGAVLHSTAPGSPQQLLLFHVLCSWLKFSRVSNMLDQRLMWALKPAQQALSWLLVAAGEPAKNPQLRCDASKACAQAVSDTAAGCDDQQHRDSASAAAASGSSTAAAEAAAGVPSASAAGLASSEQYWSGGAAAAAVLWLRVLGLCCVQLAAQLKQTQPRSVSAATLMRAETRRSALPDPAASHGDIDRQCITTYQQALATVVQLLECKPCAANLAEQGYDSKGLLQQFREAAGALEQLPNGAQEWREMCSAASVQLEAAGLALVGFATPYACNNPACSNVSGPSELLLVNGRSCVCGGCRVAHYCSRDCQRQHWKLHKPVCQALAAAACAKATPVATAAAGQ